MRVLRRRISSKMVKKSFVWKKPTIKSKVQYRKGVKSLKPGEKFLGYGMMSMMRSIDRTSGYKK